MLAYPSNGAVTTGADFVAGFIFGMTGDNHLTEIEACYAGGALMTAEIETGIADIKKGGVDNDIQAAMQFGLAILQIPQALSTCKNMDEDIAAIESWAQIFTNPTQLAATVSKHYLFHKAEIKADISTLESDWDSDLFYKAGNDLADLMVLAIGPIESTVEGLPDLPLPLNAVPDFVAGLIFGFTGDNQLDELRVCLKDADDLVKEGKKAISDIKGLNPIAAVKDFGDIVWELPEAVAGCTGMDDDIAAIEAWAEIFKQPTKLGKTVSKNWLFHGPAIKKDITKQNEDWAAWTTSSAGNDAAIVITGLVGPVEPIKDGLPPLPLPLNAIPDFIAGLIFGFTGDNHLDELRTCVTDADALVQDATVVISDIKELHLVQSAKDIGKVIWQLPEAVAGCTGMDDDIAAIEAWAQIFKQPKKLAETASKHWLFHGTAIKKDIAKEKEDWAAEDYFSAGEDAAEVIEELVGPVLLPSIPLFGALQ
eukprot:CAMPEP_0170455760 /NCGR_PEP_ID=MMETSP0123-20130129/3613_1 /TAXON_ID=182087 /ORGANISM="Favella ehrenbergii, Strain Fehren 1" /LENGTH=479 /DNA_ID=CAMNT_0010718997 /DNA_START=15 /DNA_END=1454 /DNA_ORIENTATION=+